MACLYIGGYFVLQWQHVLIRTTSCYSLAGDNALDEDSAIHDGLWIGDENYQLKFEISRAADTIFTPLGVIESEVRNRFFLKVNVKR